jgi:hypothetical protein
MKVRKCWLLTMIFVVTWIEPQIESVETNNEVGLQL